MSLEEKFESDASEWKDHCEQVKYSSNPNDYVNCDAYKNIVALGKEALPLIQKTAGTTELFWSIAVQEIAGEEFRIPEKYAGKRTEIEAYTKGWLDRRFSEPTVLEAYVNGWVDGRFLKQYTPPRVLIRFASTVSPEAQQEFLDEVRQILEEEGASNIPVDTEIINPPSSSATKNS